MLKKRAANTPKSLASGKISKSQKQREQKKLSKSTDKKRKHDQMKAVLASLQQSSGVSSDVKIISSKNMHRKVKVDKKAFPRVEKQEEPSESEADEIEEVERPTIVPQVVDQREVNYDGVELPEQVNYKKVERRVAQDYKDREYDSDDEVRREMLTFDERLTLVNKIDYQVYKANNPQYEPKDDKMEEVKDPAAQEEQLPIILHERELMENIENFVVTIVCGETGSGKSTQIPQFIYQAAQSCPWKFQNSNDQRPLLIGITQPRRVAAVSLAQRVASELKVDLGQQVGYQIRFDAENFNRKKTAVKFMTDGILLKEIENDFLLKHYSVVVIDEAHERSLNSDILVSLLTRIAHARCELAHKERLEKRGQNPTRFEYYPLRLVIMSATLRVEDFRENKRLFPARHSMPPNVIKIAARQYPVTTHFSKVTKDDYAEVAFKKVVKIHNELPNGGILVFLTGKKEINYLCQRLKMTLKKKYQGDSEDEGQKSSLNVTILPLYSQLSPEQQYRIFKPASEDTRVIVVATNVAETSLTIPGIRYVVDSGRTKEKMYDKSLQVSKFGVSWISQASAEQRAGRSGRTGPGHCYRLYSAALFSKMEKFSEAEILKTPLDQTILQLKAIGAKDILQFPFVTMPPQAALCAALRHLTILGALEVTDKVLRERVLDRNSKLSSDPTSINELGILLSKLPISPRFAKMLIVGAKYGVLKYTIMMVAALSVNEIFLELPQEEKAQVHEPVKEESDDELLTSIDIDRKQKKERQAARDQKKANYGRIKQARDLRAQWSSERSDCISYAKLMADYFSSIQSDEFSQTESKIKQFCEENQLQMKAIKEVHYLCIQIQKMMTKDLKKDQLEQDELFDFAKDPAESFTMPSKSDEKILQQVIITGFSENFCRIAPVFDANGFEIKVKSKTKVIYESQESREKLHLHKLSALVNSKPQYLVFHEVYATETEKDTKHYLKNVTRVDNLSWLQQLCSPIMMNYSQPLTEQSVLLNNASRADFTIAKALAKQNTKGHLVYYNKESDQVEVYVQVTFGLDRWKLGVLSSPISKLEIADLDTHYSLFAYCLLTGQVLADLPTKKMSFTPHQVLESSNLAPRVTRLIAHLRNCQVDSKLKLVERFKSDGRYLQETLSMWYSNDGQADLKSKWKKIITS